MEENDNKLIKYIVEVSWILTGTKFRSTGWHRARPESRGLAQQSRLCTRVTRSGVANIQYRIISTRRKIKCTNNVHYQLNNNQMVWLVSIGLSQVLFWIIKLKKIKKKKKEITYPHVCPKFRGIGPRTVGRWPFWQVTSPLSRLVQSNNPEVLRPEK